MPNAVFIVQNDYSVVLSTEAVQLTQHLKNINEKQLRYIILAYDYLNSPHRTKPPEERKRVAKRQVWGNVDFVPEDYKSMSEAIEEFKGLIFDHNRDYRDMLLAKHSMLGNELISEKDSNKIKNIMSTINMIEEKIEGVNIKIEKDEEKIFLKGGKELSLIEQMMRNRDAYKKKMEAIING